MRLAAIDIGTNTIRLLIGDTDQNGGYRQIFAAQKITRLGQGLAPRQMLQSEPIERSLVLLQQYGRIIAEHGVEATAAVGTSALREARNQHDFLAQARRRAGIEIAVISGEEEARLTLLGLRAALQPAPRRLLMLDIGGGSTELVLAEGPDIVAAVSTGLGVVKLTERFLAHDPPLATELTAARAAAEERLARARAKELPGASATEVFVGTAGTVTTLAAVDLGLAVYDPARVTGHRLSRERIMQLLQNLASMSLADRRNVPGLEPARADVIVAGTVICLAALDVFGFPALTVSDGGLREGIFLDLFRRMGGGSPNSGRACAAGSDA